MRFRHSRLNFAGSAHFVTTVTREHRSRFTDENICREVLEVFEYYRAKFELLCYGYVLMPEHLHAVLRQLNEGGHVSSLMENFKRLTSRKLTSAGITDAALWQEHYDDVPIPGSNALRTKLQYVHHNPVRRGLMERAEDYLWSSARDYAELGAGIVRVTTDF
jgi:putative transposase